MHIRPAAPTDFAAILTLNEESVAALSPLTRDALLRLHTPSAVHWVLERGPERDARVLGFLLALREGSDYASPNYRWFAERYARFLYVDRVVISRAVHGRGGGSFFYGRLFEHAIATNAERIACEYDVEPPNLPSRALHARFGFREVGRQTVGSGQKTKVVSLQIAEIEAEGRGL
jgi:predicted GNAT superfamily acetyltransferase